MRTIKVLNNDFMDIRLHTSGAKSETDWPPFERLADPDTCPACAGTQPKAANHHSVTLSGCGRVTDVDRKFWDAWIALNADSDLLSTGTLVVAS
jgi:hypothetical protein